MTPLARRSVPAVDEHCLVAAVGLFVDSGGGFDHRPIDPSPQEPFDRLQPAFQPAFLPAFLAPLTAALPASLPPALAAQLVTTGHKDTSQFRGPPVHHLTHRSVRTPRPGI